MTIANINRYIHHLNESLYLLDASVPIKNIESIAIILHCAMENEKRIFHSSKHAFEMCKGMNPRQTIAALFHDSVYYQIDGDFPNGTSQILSTVINFDEGLIRLNPINEHNLPVKLCADVFGFESGQKLSIYSGLNEFLSAIVASSLLVPYLKKTDLLAILVIIEATIPFRMANENGQDFFSDLSERVKKICFQLHLLDSDEEIDLFINEVLIQAVTFANKDVSGFAESKRAKFLASSWDLIEESNKPLNKVSFYTIQDYRESIFRMYRFLSNLKASQIFHAYLNFPSQEELKLLQELADQNLTFSCQYLIAKITMIAIIEALALETGGNCPISMLLGDIHCDYGKPERAEDFLPLLKDNKNLNIELLDVLEGGRDQESKRDLNSSPLAAFVYRSLGDQNMVLAFAEAKKMFNQEISSLAFLKTFDTQVVSSIIQACMKISASRRLELAALKTLLNKHL